MLSSVAQNFALSHPKVLQKIMTKPQTPPSDSLDLSWPHSVDYHIDTVGPGARSPGRGCEADTPDTGSQKPVTTYNGVPRERIRNAQPLVGNEIRVLDLKGGTRGTPLLGSLRRVRLSDHDEYEPLSYTWEDHDTVQPSDDNTEDDVHPALFLLHTDSYLNITWNCARALCSIRKSTADRAIWVDSICVNQDDPEERSHQVDLMNKIYAMAFTVLVYLGRKSSEIDSSSSLAMELLSQPNRLQLSHQLTQGEITSLKRLFGRRYFQRMWIVQEVALAQTLEFHCGPDLSYMSKFAGKPLEAVLGAQVTPPWLRHSKQAIKESASDHTRSQAEQILGLMFDTASCDCKDDRDRIFALLSLLDPGDEERLRADYNLSTTQVYSGLAAYLATKGFLWGVLMLAPRLAPNSCPGLPSWVPDWNSLGKSGLHVPNLSTHIISWSRTLRLDTMVGVANSGVITIRGVLLGSVTNAGYSEDDSFRYDAMDNDQRATTDLFVTQWGQGDSNKDVSTWTLAKLNRESQDSWGCHFKFFTRCKPARNIHHQAFMLQDYSTLLILRPHASFRDQYTLVEIGKPLVRAELPEHWNANPFFPTHGDVLPHLRLRLLKPMTDWERNYWDAILCLKEALPRLADFPRLWSHNQFTSTMSLTNKAIQEIRLINTDCPSLAKRWRKHVRVGMQILRDKARLEELIDEVRSLESKDYKQREIAARSLLPRIAGSRSDWLLDDFLGLFVRNKCVQLHGYQPLDEIEELETAALEPNLPEMDSLQQLMQWAKVTGQLLKLLREEIYTGFHWPELLTDTEIYADAQAVGESQVSYELNRRDRTSFLLRKILYQLEEQASPEFDQGERPHLGNGRYWDWRRFMSIMEQRSSFLGHIRPDVLKIQKNWKYMVGPHSGPDFGALVAHQVLAAHGFDARDGFTQIKIR